MNSLDLMAHLVADFPDPACFDRAVWTMLDMNVRYLEIQLSFNHPLADGPTIRKANYTALSHGTHLVSLLERVCAARKNTRSTTTKLFLMTYITPIFDHLTILADLLAEHGFSGAIIPDLPFETQEAQALLQSFRERGLTLIPVVAPTTTPDRLEVIRGVVSREAPVYAAARTGQTGGRSRIDSAETIAYLDALRTMFPINPICVGFGIREKSQAGFLRERGFVPVVGSAIVETITSCEEPDETEERLRKFLPLFR